MRSLGITGAAVGATDERFAGLQSTYAPKPPRPTGLPWKTLAPPAPTASSPAAAARVAPAAPTPAVERAAAKLPRRQAPAPRPPRARKVSRHDEVLAAYHQQSHRPVCEVAEQLGIAVHSLRKHVLQDGLPWRGPTREQAAARTASGRKVDSGPLVELYQQGMSMPEIAALTGHSKATVRRRIVESGIERRDDRTTRSGGQNRIEAYAAGLVDQVRSLYEQGLTQAQVGDRLGVSTKVVQGVMQRHGMAARPAAHVAGSQVGVDRAAPLKARMVAAGITAAQVRAWARRVGRPCPPQGIPPAPLVEAYLDRWKAAS